MSNGLFRDPAEWARDWGWVSRRRAVNMAQHLNHIADVIQSSMGDDEGAAMWAAEIRIVAKRLAPKRVPAERKRIAREKAATMLEP